MNKAGTEAAIRALKIIFESQDKACKAAKEYFDKTSDILAEAVKKFDEAINKNGINQSYLIGLSTQRRPERSAAEVIYDAECEQADIETCKVLLAEAAKERKVLLREPDSEVFKFKYYKEDANKFQLKLEEDKAEGGELELVLDCPPPDVA